jgi:peptidoglycan/LPS O-acetylase OafA/YrhL
MRFETKNNFDLIRLIAATQVVLVHSSEHLLKLSYSNSLVLSVLHFLPGVPIFFFVSGFLIASSYDKSSSLQVSKSSLPIASYVFFPHFGHASSFQYWPF